MDWCVIADTAAISALLYKIVSIAIGLGLVIFVHELGHFLAAKACGVKCEKFYIGFDIPSGFLPSSLLKFQWGETEYGIGILPLGGYVKMLGQDDNPANQAKENERIRRQKVASSPGVGDDAADGQVSVEDGFELDPRSYPAKPVWQRMIIISAGVIMNVIFAVIFAAIAYRAGVRYTPCVVGGTAPGDPAWVQLLKPGDKIIQIGRKGAPDEHLRFRRDLSTRVSLNGGERPIDFLVRRRGAAEPEWVSLLPNGRYKEPDSFPTVGVRPPATTRLSWSRPADTYRLQDPAFALLQGGDEVVAVDGQPLPREEATGYILAAQLEAALMQRVGQPVTLTLLRQTTSAADAPPASPAKVEVELPPVPLRRLGITMELSPVVAVQQGSPAEKAGVRVGDRLLTIDGEPLGDPMVLDQRLLDKVGQEITVGIDRGGKTQKIQITPRLPASTMPNTVIGIDSLGLAFTVPGYVASVDRDGPADIGGLIAGDRIVQAQFVVEAPEAKKKAMQELGKHYFDPITISEDLPQWPVFLWYLQLSLPDTYVKLTVERNGERIATPLTITPEESDQWFEPARGLNFTLASEVRAAETWSEAWSLGYRETKGKLIEVLLVLKKLFTGKISLFKLGSPVMIVAVAGAEASEGLPRLLVFLTFLSANLAILNFLPIPALDGGHMVFLAAEGIRGKPVSEKVQITLSLISIIALLTLMAILFTLDIQRIFL